MKKLLNKKYQNIALISDENNKIACKKKEKLIKKYGFIDLDNNKNQNPDLIIALGGDGTMLHLLHQYEKSKTAFYGINCGTIGFLMNNYNENNLIKSILEAKISKIHPLRMTAIDINNKKHVEIAINEVSLIRQLSQASKIKIKINDKERLDYLSGDGVLIATPAGSTAYNMSLRGPILPLDSNIMALTPISPFRPRNWRGAILPSNSKVEFTILDYKNRPVSATSDFIEVRNVKKVSVEEDKSISFKILFDSNHSLEERIIREQFLA